MSDDKKVTNDFELIVGEQGGQIHNADIPVRWCVTPKMVKEMEDAGVVDPHIVIAAATKDGKEMSRQVVSLTELMTYVRFTRSGDNKLHAWIVDGSNGRKKVHRRFEQKDGNSYHTDLVDTWDGTRYKLKDEHKSTTVDVTIPDGVFANKKVRPWLNWFVNLWHGGKVEDQCQFRRRTILAFTLKWIPVTLWTLLLMFGRTLAVVLPPLFGYRKGVDWKYVKKYFFKPYEISVSSLMNSTEWIDDQDFVFTRVTGKKTSWSGSKQDLIQLHVIALPFIPIIPLLTFVLWYSFNGHYAGSAVVSTSFVMGILLAITATIDLVVAIGCWVRTTPVLDKIGNNVSTKFGIFNGWMIDKKAWPWALGALGVAIIASIAAINYMIFLYVIGILGVIVVMSALGFGMLKLAEWLHYGDEKTDYTEIRELLCPNDVENQVASYKAIPKQQRSVRLWYLDVKNKICKPMQY